EVDRLLYYVEQVIAGLPGVTGRAQRERATRFVTDALTEIGRLRAMLDGDCQPAAAGAAPPRGWGGPLRVWGPARRLRGRGAGRGLPQWCAAEPTSSSALVP